MFRFQEFHIVIIVDEAVTVYEVITPVKCFFDPVVSFLIPASMIIANYKSVSHIYNPLISDPAGFPVLVLDCH